MSGPITRVNTLTAGIDLDLGRKLNWGKNIVLEFLVPDVTVPTTGLRLIQTIRKGFDRIIGDEVTAGDAHSVVIRVALVKSNSGLDVTLREKDLHVRVDGVLYAVGTVPPVAPSEAQVYTITCKTRTLRKQFFDNTK